MEVCVISSSSRTCTHVRCSKKTTANWEVTISVYTKPHGLYVDTSILTHPQPKEADLEGVCDIDIVQLHKEHLQLINFHDIVHDLNDLLAGAWQFASSSRHRYALASPVFTRQGDLLVQLVELKTGPLVVNTANGSAKSQPSLALNGSSALMQGAKLDLRESRLSDA